MRTLALILAAAGAAAAGSTRLVREDSLAIEVGQFRSVSFTVDIAQREGARLTGELVILPDTARLEILLFDIDDFARWSSGAGVQETLYAARSGAGSLDIPVEGFGDKVLVLSNRGNWEGVVASLSLDLRFEGSGVPYNPLLTGSRIVFGALVGAIALALLLGMIVTWRRNRAGRGRPPGTGVRGC
jgi:hypothetical protein